MPKIEISWATYERIKKHQALDNVLSRALDALEREDATQNRRRALFEVNATSGVSQEKAHPKSEHERPRRSPSIPSQDKRVDRKVSPNHLPDMTHTVMSAARFARRKVESEDLHWSTLLRTVLLWSANEGWNVREFAARCGIKWVEGKKTEKKHHFLGKAGFSIRRMDANHTCNSLVKVAQELGIDLRIEFDWLEKTGAAYPGDTGLINIPALAK